MKVVLQIKPFSTDFLKKSTVLLHGRYAAVQRKTILYNLSLHHAVFFLIQTRKVLFAL